MNIDLYEMFYKSHKLNDGKIPAKNINITKDMTKTTLNLLSGINKNRSIINDEISFSDIDFNLIPVFNEDTKQLSYNYEWFFVIKDNGKNPAEYIERYKNFDINSLPLIGIARLLNIKVEKSSVLREAYGQFEPANNVIILNTDYIPTYIHELAHAIDYILGNTYEDYYKENIRNFDELVAEASTVVICKTYNIKINEAYSIRYLDSYSNCDINASELIKRVSLICEYIKRCIEKIKCENKDN